MLTDDVDFSPLTGELEHEASLLDPGGSDSVYTPPQAAQLSPHALSGMHPADTFRISGLIGSEMVRVLIDGGSTHNLIKSPLQVNWAWPILLSRPSKFWLVMGKNLSVLRYVLLFPLSFNLILSLWTSTLWA